MPDDLLDDYRGRLLARYRDQIEGYADHFSRLDDRATHLPIKPGQWSAHQVLFHVCATDEQAYGPRLRRILREDHPDLEDFDSETWFADHYDVAEPARAILDRWRSVRGSYAAELETAPRQAWSRSGRQPYWGERTLQWWVERAVTHGEDHRRQLLGE